MNTRFKWIKKWMEPVFFEDRLQEPRTKKKHCNIFVGSMCDLFGDWVPHLWISRVLRVVEQNPQHTFIFLTKNPRRYRDFDIPQNCYLGMTVTNGRDVENKIHHFLTIDSRTFLSIEPLLGGFEDGVPQGVGLVIVGAMTGPGAVKPKREWIESIKHPNIYFKAHKKLGPEWWRNL